MQLRAVRRFLAKISASALHHGECVGADAQAGIIAASLGIEVVGHPPTNNKLRAQCIVTSRMAPRPYLVRNAAIVAAADLVLAAPWGRTEVMRGEGTWATIRQARRTGKPLYMAWTDREEVEVDDAGIGNVGDW